MEQLISIVIPAYNRAALIGETLSSISKQSYENWECIVVDDGSSDDTVAVVTAFAKAESRISIHKRPSTLPKGANACRNHGYALSNGKYVMFYDSDDAMLPFKLESHLAGFKGHPEIDGFVMNSAYYNFDTGNAYRKWRPQLWSSELLQDFLLQRAGWQTGDVLWLKKSIQDLNFCEDLHSYQDYDFHARAILSDMKLAYQDIIASHIRHTTGSIKLTKSSNSIISEWRTRFRTIKMAMDQERVDEKFANEMLPSLYTITSQIAGLKQYRNFFSSLVVLYRISSIANKRAYFFKTICFTYPKKFLSSIL